MQRTQFGDMTCSIARTLDLIGEPWSPLILRDVMVGIRRFDQIQADLGISRKVLTERLKWLVDCGGNVSVSMLTATSGRARSAASRAAGCRMPICGPAR